MRSRIGLGFMGLLVFSAVLLFSEIEYLEDTKKIVYRQLSMPIEWIKDRNLDEYKTLSQKILNGELPLKVHFNAISNVGYGNKMYSVLTSMVYAILTDSVLVISTWGPNIREYIDEPFNRTFYNFSQVENGLNIDYKNEEIVLANVTTLQTMAWNKTHARTLYKIIDAVFFGLCSERHYYEKLYEYGLVERETIDEVIERTLERNNEKYTEQEQFRAFFSIGYEVAGSLLDMFKYITISSCCNGLILIFKAIFSINTGFLTKI
jgi:hypothetical protein